MSLADILQLMKDHGPAAVFAIMWWLERSERIDAQAEVKIIAKDGHICITAVEKTISNWAALFSKLTGGKE